MAIKRLKMIEDNNIGYSFRKNTCVSKKLVFSLSSKINTEINKKYIRLDISIVTKMYLIVFIIALIKLCIIRLN